ncbi:hypothetical protein K2Z84_14845 [Candidatus Binatia bacterium]|nr:hypothetical protein [Candidatus Binatia bacterium]
MRSALDPVAPVQAANGERPTRRTLLRVLVAWWAILVLLTACIFGSVQPIVLLLVLVDGPLLLPYGLLCLTGATSPGTPVLTATVAAYCGAMLLLHAACVAYRRWWTVVVIVGLASASFGGCLTRVTPILEMRRAFN